MVKTKVGAQRKYNLLQKTVKFHNTFNEYIELKH